MKLQHKTRKGAKNLDKPEKEQFLVYLEFDNEEVQEIKHKMDQAIETFQKCV